MNIRFNQRPMSFRAHLWCGAYRFFAGAVMLWFASLSPPANAEDAEADQSDRLVRQWYSTYDQIADSFDVIPHEGEPETTRHAQPLLTYTNPVRRDSQHGRIYLWESENRPVVIGSVWSSVDRRDATQRNVAFEFHSLGQSDVSVQRNGLLEWSSAEPGVEWLPINGATPATTSRTRRLLQMKSLMRQFRAAIDSEESELRLLDQPVYRYAENVPGAVDGAIFAFVMGTDPELFAIIEARGEEAQGEAGASQWRIAFARFTHHPMSVSQSNTPLWSCVDAEPNVRSGAYMIQWKSERRDAVDPDVVRDVELK